jgi:hypothetical protein
MDETVWAIRQPHVESLPLIGWAGIKNEPAAGRSGRIWVIDSRRATAH